jgi:hypothetical protein
MTAPAKKATKPRKGRAATNGATTNGAPKAVRPAEAGPTQDPWHPPAPDPDAYVPTTVPEKPAAETPPEPEKPAVPEHPYGDVDIYTFTPTPGGTAGDGPIVFPAIRSLRPTYHFLWKIRKLDQVQQSFEWMDFAKVPDEIQERVALLSDEDQGRFFTGWFTSAINAPAVGPPGES